MRENKICNKIKSVYDCIKDYILNKDERREEKDIAKVREQKYADFMKYSNCSKLSGTYKVTVDDKSNTIKTIIYTDNGALIETKSLIDDGLRTYEGFVTSCNEVGEYCRNYVNATCCAFEEDGKRVYYYETFERMNDGSFELDYSTYAPIKPVTLNVPEEVDERYLTLANRFMIEKSQSKPLDMSYAYM